MALISNRCWNNDPNLEDGPWTISFGAWSNEALDAQKREREATEKKKQPQPKPKRKSAKTS